MLQGLGFVDVRIVEESPIVPSNPDMTTKLEGFSFVSRTISAFKLDDLEDRYHALMLSAALSHAVTDAKIMAKLRLTKAPSRAAQTGSCSILRTPSPRLRLREFAVPFPRVPSRLLILNSLGNTASMLLETRFAAHFVVTQRGAHAGLFDCSPPSSCRPSCPPSSSSCC